ncbi:MAG: FAD-binding protein [Acidimicrobiia bacterium]|jgi:glycolate oxidase FAD binding subunit|nr:FAD-binding protein [Acidimicrobiia bacterium]
MTAADVVVGAFADEVGGADAGPVVAVGAGTAAHLGGPVDPGTRAVGAPAGIVALAPADMTVRVRAGTPVAELDAALAEVGQCVAVPARSPAATVGGALAVGRTGTYRLGWGPVRDAVLEITAVLADGGVAKVGGPTVKNVSGYDLCRVLVGSLGTLAVLAEVVLRTRPLPACERWHRAPPEADALAVLRSLHRPLTVLWDGATTWVLLAGHPEDVEVEAAAAGLAVIDDRAATLPDLAALPERWSVRPSSVPALVGDGHGPFVAEVGVGIVHRRIPPPPRPVDPAVRRVHERLKAAFDPTGRLAPGRAVLT